MTALARLLYFVLLLYVSMVSTAMTKVTYELHGVDASIADNILAHIGDGQAQTTANNQILHKAIITASTKAVNALGYYNPQFKLIITDVRNNNLKAIINATLGPVTKLAKVDIQLIGEGSHDNILQSLVSEVNLNVEDPLNHGRYEEAKSSIAQLAMQRGYFDSHYSNHQIQVSRQNNSANILLHFNTGPRYQFGQIVFTKNTYIDLLVLKLIPFTKGDWYDVNKIVKLNAILADTNYFRYATIKPKLADAKDLQVPIEIELTLNAKNTLATGMGYSTDMGFRGSLKWQRPLLNSQGHSVNSELSLSLPSKKAIINYKIPITDTTNNYLNIQAGYEHLQENNRKHENYVIKLQNHHKTISDWQQISYLSYNVELSHYNDNKLRYQSIIPGISFAKTQTQKNNNIYWRNDQFMYLEASNNAWLSDSNFIKFYWHGKWRRTLWRNIKIIPRLDIGAIYTANITKIPHNVRFFSGGATSIRGFEYHKVSPKDSADRFIGGKYLTVGSLELAFPVALKWHIMTFVDVGTVTNDFSEQIKISSGIGVSWSSPVGFVKAYLATPINSKDRAIDQLSAVKLHFLIEAEL